jgi:hypothetical protein
MIVTLPSDVSNDLDYMDPEERRMEFKEELDSIRYKHDVGMLRRNITRRKRKK